MAEMVQFSQGEEVEVGNNEKGLKGSWYAATVLQCSRRSSRSTASKRKRTLFVEYHTLMADKGVKPLKENVSLSRVRPKPPQDEADRSFQVDEKVEVFDNDGWWEGTVTGVLENQRYRVHFKESNQEFEYHRSELRTHLEWIDGRWVCAAAVVQEQEIVVTSDDQGQNETLRQVQSGDQAENTGHNIVLASQFNLDTAEYVASENSPGKVQSRDIQNTNLANSGDASQNVEMKKSPSSFRISSKEISVALHNQCRPEPRRETQSEQAINTDQIIDLDSPLSLDATYNVAIKLLPVQAPARQDKKTFSTDMASSGDVVKNVASKKSLSLGISRKVDNQSSSYQAGSPSSLSGEVVKTPMSLIACPVRGMSLIACPVRGMSSVGTLSKASGQHDFTTPTRESQVTNVEGNRARSPVVDENVLDQLLKRYRKDHLELLNSGQDQTKHDLETNQPRNHPSVERFSSDLPNSIAREENQVADSTKIQALARQLKLGVQMPREKRKPFGGDDIEHHEMEGVRKQMMPAVYKRRQGPRHTASSQETSTFVVQAEDTLKEIEVDGASNNNRDLDQQIAMCIEESYLPSSINEQGASSANQPMVQAMEGITCKDTLMWGHELPNTQNVMDNFYSLEGIIVDNQLDEAIGDEHNECVMQSFLIEDETPREDEAPREDESLPFVKCSTLWGIVESNDIFRAMPQRHFHPLKQFNMELREGLAIGLTWSFTNIVEKIGKAKFDDPMCNLQVMLNALEDLKAHGFNAKPIQARLEKLLWIKEEQEQISSQLVEAEEKIIQKQHEKVMLETELEEIGMEMMEMQKCLDEMKKKWISVEGKNEEQGLEIAELKTTVNRLRERFQRARIEFNGVVADPW